MTQNEPLRSREQVVVSNFWHRPGITVCVLHGGAVAPHGGITLETALDDYLKALAQEMAHPVKVWTRGQLETALRAASSVVLEKIKIASTQAMVGTQ